MSTDAFFFFHMDRDTQGTPAPATAADHERAARLSTSSSSVVSSHARKQFLVEYSPKPAVPAVAVHPRHHHRQEREQQREVTTQALAIHRWLATHRSYEPIEHSSFSSDEESDEEPEDEDTEAESDEDDEDDQIYMAPRRQHSAPSILPVPQPQQPLPLTASAVPRKAWPLSAARPAMPVVDRAEATAFTTVLLQDKEKSYWSDDDEDDEQEQEWLEEDDDLDLPALDEDSGAPASTSTRSLPIPIFAPPRTHSHSNINDAERARCEPDFDSLWNSSPPSKQRRPQDGQSFWAPWIKDYMATQKLVQ